MNQIDELPELRTPGKPRRWQLNLFTMLLLTGAIGVIVAWYRAYHGSALVLAEIERLRAVSAELVILEANQFAVVDVPQQWHDENVWDVYLPPGQQYSLCLATRDVIGGYPQQLPEPREQYSLKAGKYRIALECVREPSGEWETRVLVDGEPRLQVREPADWNSATGGSGSGRRPESRQQLATEPLILRWWRFYGASGAGIINADQPGNGHTLWIERSTSPEHNTPHSSDAE